MDFVFVWDTEDQETKPNDVLVYQRFIPIFWCKQVCIPKSFLLFYWKYLSTNLWYIGFKVQVEFFPKQCGNTWGSYGRCKKPGWLDRGGGRVAHGFHRYFRGFVLACSFRL